MAGGHANEPLPEILQVTLLADVSLRRRGCEQFEPANVIVIRDRRRKIGIGKSLRIASDAEVNAPQLQIQRDPLHHLDRCFAEVAWIELPDRFTRPVRPPVPTKFQPYEATFERMNVFEFDTGNLEQYSLSAISVLAERALQRSCQGES